jgi:transcriptional regulator with AAA-type ATPase domain
MSQTLGHTLGATQTPPRREESAEARPHLYVALECDRPAGLSARHDLGDVVEVAIGRGAARESERINLAGSRGLQVRIPDRWMSSAHARLSLQFGRWMLEDLGSKNGTLVNGAAVARHALQDGDLVELGHTLLLYRDAVLPRPGDAPDVDLARGDRPPGMTTLNSALAADLARLEQLAPTPVSILLLGETGTGKEVVARAIHDRSGRPGDMVGVNCGAIPDSLIESELFGHKKGAFSGAVADSPGLVRAAHGGTLFLDEIADLPAASQAAFLRVLQEREVRPVGATRADPVDIRLVSATHQDLPGKAERGEFRNDLYGRIAGYRMTLPALRDRREDLGYLVGVLLARLAPGRAPAIDVEAARALYRYGWPRNIRELESALQTALVLAGDQAIALAHLPEPVRVGESAQPARGSEPPALTAEDRAHRDELAALFREHGGNVSAVARALGKDRKQVQRWLKKYGLDPASFR